MPQLIRRPERHTGFLASPGDSTTVHGHGDLPAFLGSKDEHAREIGQPRLEHQLSPWTNGNDPALALVLGFVAPWPIDPNRALAVDFAESHRANLAGPHAGDQLETRHGPVGLA
jgi:hypothetical protein